MKKITFALIAVTAIFVSSADSCHNAKSASDSTWGILGHTYKATSVTTQNNNQLMAEDANGNSVQIFFNTLPTSGSQTYNVVDEAKAAHGTLASNELAVEINVGANDVYLSSPSTNRQADVYVSSDGRLGVHLTYAPLVHYAGGAALDTAQAIVSISQ